MAIASGKFCFVALALSISKESVFLHSSSGPFSKGFRDVWLSFMMDLKGPVLSSLKLV
jgi:hypothetical protein